MSEKAKPQVSVRDAESGGRGTRWHKVSFTLNFLDT